MYQTTVSNEISATGIGAHSGKKTVIRLKPAPINSGIIFRRIDISPAVEVPAILENVTSTSFSTTISNGNVSVSTIEHLMSAIYALGIDNLYIDINDVEVPIMDGSADAFIFIIHSAGITEQHELKKFIKLKKLVKIEGRDNGTYASLEPYDGFCLSFSVVYDHPMFKSNCSLDNFEFSKVAFIKEISRARTYGFLCDYDKLISMNLALGSSLKNAIVLDDKKIINDDGLRLKDEFVKHKILDSIGDLFLLGHRIIGKFTGHKSGHELNNRLSRLLMKDKSAWEYVSFPSKELAPLGYSSF